jgi:hypothetical protein
MFSTHSIFFLKNYFDTVWFFPSEKLFKIGD